MDAVQRRGSAARMNYIKRFLSVLVAFVLCLGLIQPPRAKAIVPAVVLAYGSGMAVSAIASVLGSFIAAYVGLRIEQPMVTVGDGYVMGTGGYDFGSMIWPAVVTAGSAAVKKWWEDTIAFFEAKGGFAAGDEITIPADVAEFARNWIVENYDFTTGDVTFSQTGISDASGNFIVFTAPNYPYQLGRSYNLPNIGTLFNAPVDFVFRDSSGVNVKYSFWESGDSFKITVFYGKGQMGYGSSFLFSEYRISFTLYRPEGLSGDVFLVPLFYRISDGFSFLPSTFNAGYFLKVTDLVVPTLTSSVSATDALNTPVTKDMTVAIPKDVAMGKVGVWDIPATTELTKEGILVGQGEVVEPTAAPQPTAIPGEGTMVGDIAIEGIQTAAQDKSLGALFISKFPFCIPWDFVNAVKLLAAPPKTPYWEVDFLAPVAYRFGGFKGDTTLVIDFSDYEILGQLCRWVSTIMFVAALAQGTKRLIWTA